MNVQLKEQNTQNKYNASAIMLFSIPLPSSLKGNKMSSE